MARHTHWMATVALSLLLCFTIINVLAQAPSLKTNLTYSCQAQPLQSVIEHLSKHSGYDFIYSRNLVDVSQRVSLVVKNKPINEVLALIGKQVGVSFKIKDNHIIIKTAEKIKAKAVADLAITETHVRTLQARTLPEIAIESHAALLKSNLDKRIREVQELLGPEAPRTISPYYISRINFNNQHRGWFASLGTYVGDNASGVEIQAGLPYVYAVFRPRFTSEEGFYASYGVGNSINLVGNFSLNTIYMYSSRVRSKNIYSRVPTNPPITNTITTRQHQVKLAVQYSFSNKILLRAGPVLNYQTTLSEAVITGSVESYPAYGYNKGQNQPLRLVRSSRLFESWLGWEASIQYRINFFNPK